MSVGQKKNFNFCTVKAHFHFIRISDFASESIVLVIDDVIDTLDQIQTSNPNSRIAFSSVIRRKDDQSINTKARKLNGLLEEELAINGFDIIDNGNIQYSNLRKDGLHVNEGGIRKLSGNLSRYIKYCLGSFSSDKNTAASSNMRSCKRNGLKIAFLNIVSLRKHRRELKIVLNDNDIDIIGLSETRLDETVRDSDVNINGYSIYRNDRNANGGGVAIYVKESLSEPTVKIKSDKLELVALEFTSNHAKPFLVMCWYRPPTSGVDDESFENLRNILKEVDKEEKEIILIGDTNCDFKNNQNANAKKLKMIYSEFQFEQIINKYTRVAVTTNEQNEQKTTKTLIDHFSTASPRYILRADVYDNYVPKAIKQLKNGKAPGPDKIPTMLIKDAADLIFKTLTMVLNSSLRKGIFPDVWKLARVTPIFKSGSKSEANNYRPISVISVFSRILERIVHDQVYEYLKANKVLTMSQSAFQKLCSTITSLIDSTDYWYENIDHKQFNLATFLDLKKAFDTVDHKILLEKLSKYGIRELSGDWFQSYLKNRRQ